MMKACKRQRRMALDRIDHERTGSAGQDVNVPGADPGQKLRDVFCSGQTTSSHLGGRIATKAMSDLKNVIDFRIANSRKEPNPEGLVHNAVTVGEIAMNAEITAFKIGLTNEIAAKQKPGPDLL